MDENDKRNNEPYLKIMFPGFKDRSLRLTKNIGRREIDGKIIELSNTQNPIKSECVEISYHYFAGVRHLKGRSGEHESQSRDFPDLRSTIKPVLVCAFYIADTSLIDEISSDLLADSDIVLENFSFPTEINFFISYKDKDSGKLTYIKHIDGKSHKLVSSIDERTAITITELKYTNIHPSARKSGLHINYDPYSWEKGTSFFSKLLFKFKHHLSKWSH